MAISKFRTSLILVFACKLRFFSKGGGGGSPLGSATESQPGCSSKVCSYNIKAGSSGKVKSI